MKRIVQFFKNIYYYLDTKILLLQKNILQARHHLFSRRKRIITITVTIVFVLSAILSLGIPLARKIKNSEPRGNITQTAKEISGTKTREIGQDEDESETGDFGDAEDESGDEEGAPSGTKSNVSTSTAAGTSTTYYHISFETNGGEPIEPVSVKKGLTLASLPLAQKDEETFAGWYLDQTLTEPFYQSDPINNDLTLYAAYEGMEERQTLLYEKFVLKDQDPGLTITVNSVLPLTTDQVLDKLTLEIADGTQYINLIVTGSNPYSVSADGGFTPGASYELKLDDGLTFDGHLDACRICTFFIHKDEVVNLQLRDDMVYIPASEVSSVRNSDGDSMDSLEVVLFGEIDVSGFFTYSGIQTLSEDQFACVYSGTHPSQRNENGDYSDQDISYIKITGVDGTSISFRSVEKSEITNILFMPDTIPIDIQDFPLKEQAFANFTFDFIFDPADYVDYEGLGIDSDTTLDSGDFIALYNQLDDSYLKYLEILTVSTTDGVSTITYKEVTLEEMQASVDYYVRQMQSGQTMLTNVNVSALEEQIELQALNSGFVQETMDYLAAVSTQTEGFQDISGVESYILMDEDGNLLSKDEIALLWDKAGAARGVENLSIDADIDVITDDPLTGIQVKLTVNGTYAVDISDNNTMQITIQATFIEQVQVMIAISGGAEWGFEKIWGIPIYCLKDFNMTTVVDVCNFTGFYLDIYITSDYMPDKYHVTNQLNNLLAAENEQDVRTGVDELFDKYSEILSNQTDYIELCSVPVFDKEGWVDPFHIAVYAIEVDLKIKADINLVLDAKMEYTSGTRYIFTFKLMSLTASSKTIDLMDEDFYFQFYVLGKLGIKVGLKFDFGVGLFTTKLGKIGLSAEVGPYIDFYGYFVYIYHKTRTANTPTWAVDEKIQGALYVEFGMYLEVYFNANALDGTYTYSYEIYSEKWPLLSAGEAAHVYKFGYEIEDDEQYVIRDLHYAYLPKAYRNMRVIDLKTGNKYKYWYQVPDYNYIVSNKHFSINPSTGLISVEVPTGIRYLECDITMVWKPQKLAFSSYDLTSTIHIVWTNLTDKELNEKFEVCVRVGDPEIGDYVTVWSDRVVKQGQFTLPTEAEVLEMIGFADNTAIIDGHTRNLEYLDADGYENVSDLAQTVVDDRTYVFNVQKRIYSLWVDDIQTESGGTESRKFEAEFNESFDLSSLEETGSGFNKYVKTVSNPDDGNQATDPISWDFAIQLIENNTEYTAEYVDNSCKVTYNFVVDINTAIPSATETVEKGTKPSTDFTSDLAALMPSVKIDNWEPEIGVVNGDTTFTANCSFTNDMIYTITLEENGGEEIKDIMRFADQPVKASKCIREGYTLSGWFLDEALENEYVFDTMPAENFTLYAGWEANVFNITLHGGIVDLSAEDQSRTVTFGQPYGNLPVPDPGGSYGFMGWYTTLYPEPMIENKVDEETIVAIDGEHDLYADYKELIEIPREQIWEPELVTKTYDGTPLEFELQYTTPAAQGGVCDGFTVEYRRISPTAYAEDDYSSEAVNAGTYNVRVTRPQDDTYMKYDEVFDSVLVIEKAYRNIPTISNLTVSSKNFYSITVNPVILDECDGIIEYGAGHYFESPSEWTTSCTVRVPFQYGTTMYSYHIYARVRGGQNYYDAACAIKTEVTMASYNVSSSSTWTFTNKDVMWDPDMDAGTKIYGRMIYVDDAEDEHNYAPFSDAQEFEIDFTSGSTSTATMAYNGSPWIIQDFAVGTNNISDAQDWQPDLIEIATAGITSSHSFYSSSLGYYQTIQSLDYELLEFSSHKRNITSVGEFAAWGGAYSVNSESTGNIALSFDGKIQTQYTGYSNISCYTLADPPRMTVALADATHEAEYNGCYYYSDYQLVIDRAKMYEAMEKTGDTSVTINASLNFPTRSTVSSTAEWNEMIVINKAD